MRYRRTPIVLLLGIALLSGASLASAALDHPAAPAASRLARLIIKPNPVPIGRRIVVIMTGLNPGEPVQFTARRPRAGFGGGNMGTHRAGKDGTILFSYSGFTQQSDVGTWLITARRASGAILQVRLNVTEPPTPVLTPVYPPLATVPRWRMPLPGRSSGAGAVSGSTVVATVAGPGPGCSSTIYLRQILHGRWQPIVRLGRNICQLDVRLSAQWLVWLAGHYPAPGWQLWASSRTTHRRHLVDSSATEGGTAAPSFPEISLSGDTLAWVRHDCLQGCTRPGPSTLRVVDLRGGAASLISRVTYICRQIAFPALSGTVLSWVSVPLSGYGCPAPNTWTVVARDRRTGKLSFHEIHLNRNQMADEFTGYGQREAWVEHLAFTNRDDRVVLMNLRGGAQRTIAVHGASSPRLADHVLAWIGSSGDRVEALDLRTGRRYLLAHGITGPNQNVALGIRLGQSWQDRVIWEEGAFNPNGGPIHDSVVVATVP